MHSVEGAAAPVLDCRARAVLMLTVCSVSCAQGRPLRLQHHHADRRCGMGCVRHDSKATTMGRSARGTPSHALPAYVPFLILKVRHVENVVVASSWNACKVAPRPCTCSSGEPTASLAVEPMMLATLVGGHCTVRDNTGLVYRL